MDIMRSIPFAQLMDWTLTEYETHKTVFGIKKFVSLTDDSTSFEIFGSKLESPLGPAAGPHTQLAQNLIAGYVAGGRFFELKTVQQLDGEDLAKCIGKPCINAADEGYNCEWSTELTVPQAFEEYVKGFVALKLISTEFGLGDPNGFIFNMSAGYDYQGITGAKVDKFLTEMMDCSNTPIWNECIQWAKDNVHRFQKVTIDHINQIQPSITNNITLSTMHGCPPEEIERIATHLLEVKKLNTYVKCNPTLLGYEKTRAILDGLGFDYVTFDDHHFKADLQFKDAVPMLERLLEKAKAQGLSFGVKLTNTFPTKIANNELPGEEMYMSGRALYPLSLNVALLLAEKFGNRLPMSFSGGIDQNNLKAVLDCGIWPLTVATILLKPGGYEKFSLLISKIKNLGEQKFNGINVEQLTQEVHNIENSPFYRKKERPGANLPPSAVTRDAQGNIIPQNQLPKCLNGCNICAQVCPNRSNATVKTEGDKFETVCHIDGMCNECGNCATFCPTKKTPYRDKFTLFWNEEDFVNSTNQGFWPHDDGTFSVRLLGNVYQHITLDDQRLDEMSRKLIDSFMKTKRFTTLI